MTLPERADYSLTESVFAPFPAEPAHLVVSFPSRLLPPRPARERMKLRLQRAEPQWGGRPCPPPQGEGVFARDDTREFLPGQPRLIMHPADSLPRGEISTELRAI